MPTVKIRIYKGTNFNDKDLVSTQYVQARSAKQLTGKRAGQILANQLPRFDGLTTRNGLQKCDDGFLAMRPLEPKENCDYNYVWEFAVVTHESE